MLAAHGYLSAAIQHDLPSDPPLTGNGELAQGFADLGCALGRGELGREQLLGLEQQRVEPGRRADGVAVRARRCTGRILDRAGGVEPRRDK